MDFEELLEYLDLENGAQFEYFEAMADLVECEEYIEPEAIYALFDQADKTMIEELINDYFEDILDGLPENSGEIFSLLHQIEMSFKGMVSNIQDKDDLRKFADEFYRFINWYSHESEVELTPLGEGIAYCSNVRDAITAARLEKLGGEKYRYDFENSLDYELDSYVMSFADLVNAENENEGRITYSPEDGEPGDDYMQ